MKPQIIKDYYDIVILPPAPVRDYAIRVSKQLYHSGAKWKLGRRTFLPHISLYHIKIKPKNFQKCMDVLRNLTLRTAAHTIATGTVRTYSNFGYDIPCTRPQWLYTFHKKIIKNLSPFFDHAGSDHLWKRYPWYTKTMDSLLKRYGSPVVGTAFHPHITLAVFADASLAESVQRHALPRPRKFRFVPQTVSVCAIGPSHSCQKIVDSFPLKNA